MRLAIFALAVLFGFGGMQARYAQVCYAQVRNAPQKSLKIKKVIDANLFLSSQGDTVQLAGISTPSLYSKDVRLQSLAAEITEYARKIFNDARTYFEAVDTSQNGRIMAIAYRQFLLRKECINLEYLRRGFAEFVPHPAIKDSAAYLEAQQYARQQGRGIWNLKKYRLKTQNAFHYFRMAGGILAVHFPNKYHNDLIVPVVSLGYHYGDLLKFSPGAKTHLTLAAQVYTFWNIFLPMLQFGPELYWKNFRIGVYGGNIYPVLLPNVFGTGGRPIKIGSIEVGVRRVKANGEWYEVLFTAYWPSNFVFKIELNFPGL
ncbi:thermonuclease family protein [Caldithrix abyssi]